MSTNWTYRYRCLACDRELDGVRWLHGDDELAAIWQIRHTLIRTYDVLNAHGVYHIKITNNDGILDFLREHAEHQVTILNEYSQSTETPCIPAPTTEQELEEAKQRIRQLEEELAHNRRQAVVYKSAFGALEREAKL